MTVKLGYLVRFRNGQDAKNVEDPNGEYPIIGSGGAFSRANEFLHDGESLLFGRKGTIDRPLHVNGKFWTVDTMYYTEIGPEASGRYLYYWATTIPFDKISTQTALPSMTSFKLSQLEVPLPDLPTQHRIADYLDRENAQIDAMDGALDGLVARLEERRLSIITSLTGTHPEDQRKTAPLGMLFAHIGSGTTPSDPRDYTDWSEEGVPWVTTSELRENRVTETKKKVTNSAVANIASLTLHPRGSLAIAMYGATIGRLGILGIDATSNQACCLFSKGRLTDTKFVFYCLLAQRAEIVREASGGGQPNISQGFLRRWRVPAPPLDEQRRIVAHLDTETAKIDAMIAKAGELRALLSERRSALITATVTGQHPVPEEP